MEMSANDAGPHNYWDPVKLEQLISLRRNFIDESLDFLAYMWTFGHPTARISRNILEAHLNCIIDTVIDRVPWQETERAALLRLRQEHPRAGWQIIARRFRQAQLAGLPRRHIVALPRRYEQFYTSAQARSLQQQQPQPVQPDTQDVLTVARVPTNPLPSQSVGITASTSRPPHIVQVMPRISADIGRTLPGLETIRPLHGFSKTGITEPMQYASINYQVRWPTPQPDDRSAVGQIEGAKDLKDPVVIYPLAPPISALSVLHNARPIDLPALFGDNSRANPVRTNMNPQIGTQSGESSGASSSNALVLARMGTSSNGMYISPFNTVLPSLATGVDQNNAIVIEDSPRVTPDPCADQSTEKLEIGHQQERGSSETMETRSAEPVEQAYEGDLPVDQDRSVQRPQRNNNRDGDSRAQDTKETGRDLRSICAPDLDGSGEDSDMIDV